MALSAGCPCIDSSIYTSSLENCIVDGDVNETGFWVYNTAQVPTGGACYPLSYGANVCKAHDADVDPRCLSENPPLYCGKEWCYVDGQRCKDSDEQFYLSSVPPFGEQDVFYSYSACNSTSKEWDEFNTINVVAGKTISVTFAAIWHPPHFKDSEIDDWGEQHYYDDNIPWRGWVVDYLDAVLKVSNIGRFNYTYRSRGSHVVSGSHYTAAVGDVRAGITDVVATSLWVTSERLAMSPFTVTTQSDRIYLWVPSPTVTEAGHAQKVLEPFDSQLWISLIISILVVSFLSLLFATPVSGRRTWWKQLRGEKWEQASLSRKILMGLRIMCDAFGAHALFFFGHTVDYDIRASYPAKILNFGYGFLILIAVAAYTANLAAFLTLSNISNYIESMEDAVANKVVLCAPIALKDNLSEAWPYALFEFYPGSPPEEVFSLYDASVCGAIIGSEWDFRQAPEMISNLCDRDFIKTESVAVEVPIGFAVNPKLSASLSYWMVLAAKRGITFASFEESSRPPLACSLKLPEVELDEMTSLTAADFILPFCVLSVCAVLAVIVHVLQKSRESIQEKKSLEEEEIMFFAESNLSLTAHLEVPEKTEDDHSTRIPPEQKLHGNDSNFAPSSVSKPGKEDQVRKHSIGLLAAKRRPRFSQAKPSRPSTMGAARPSTMGMTRMSLLDLAEDNEQVDIMLDMMKEVLQNQERMQSYQERLHNNQERMQNKQDRICEVIDKGNTNQGEFNFDPS